MQVKQIYLLQNLLHFALSYMVTMVISNASQTGKWHDICSQNISDEAQNNFLYFPFFGMRIVWFLIIKCIHKSAVIFECEYRKFIFLNPVWYVLESPLAFQTVFN